MSREEAIEYGMMWLDMNEDAKDTQTYQFYSMAIEALKAEPYEDCISRQAVLEQTYNWSKDEFLRVTNPFDYLRKRINSLPSVKPQEPKTGHWIEIVVNGQHKIKCDKCDYIEPLYITHIRNFCPNCGARMESEVSE